jgi:hypothetical protein
MLTLLLLLPAAPPAPDGGGHTLHFVPNAVATTADLGALGPYAETALGQLGDTEVAAFTPGLDASAIKQLALAELTCLLGDCDKDGWYFDAPWGDLDALGPRLYGPDVTGPLITDWLFSTEEEWCGGDEYSFVDGPGAVDGTVFALARDPTTGQADVVFFLREVLVLRAIGQLGDPASDGVDVDAFAQDELGDIFLSFRVDEQVNGVLLADDGVVCLPAETLDYDAALNVKDVEAGAAVIVLDEAASDALVAHAGLLTASGKAIKSLQDLQALELDPAGGVFPSVQPVPGFEGAPNLLFNGQNLGPTVLTTADGGRIATLNGKPLGSPGLSGAPLGLDEDSSSGSGFDLNALAVTPAAPPHLCVDVVQGVVDLQAVALPAEVGFLVGGATPHGPLLLLVRVETPGFGAGLSALPAPPGAGYPHVFVPAPVVLAVALADAHGRALATFAATEAPPVPMWVVLQAADLARHELSPPAGLWCP